MSILRILFKGNKELFRGLEICDYEIEKSFQSYFVSSLEERNPIKVASLIAKLQRTMLANYTSTMQQVMISHIAAIPCANRSKMGKTIKILSIRFSG